MVIRVENLWHPFSIKAIKIRANLIWKNIFEISNAKPLVVSVIWHYRLRAILMLHWHFLCFFFVRVANSSPKIFGPSYKRIEGLSIVEQNELKGAAWFQAGIPREISLEVLSRQNPGAFMVRKSSQAGAFALSLRVPPPAPKVAHYLILRTSRGYKIKVSILLIYF